MSNWQISHTMNVLTATNNKLDILTRISEILQSGISKKNIFIITRSYSFNSNYTGYFGENILRNNGIGYIDIVKISKMGILVPLMENTRIEEINLLLAINKRINSYMREMHHCRFISINLKRAYASLEIDGIDSAVEVLISGAKNQVRDIYSRRLNPDPINMQRDLRKLETIKNIKVSKTGNFSYYFNNTTRPIVGVYDAEKKSFYIINADQLYKGGEESKTQIKLESITKNSPVAMTFVVVGAMAAVMGYLAYRDKKTDIPDDSMIKKDRMKMLNNVISANNSSATKGGNCLCDADVINLASDTCSKLEGALNKSKIELEKGQKE